MTTIWDPNSTGNMAVPQRITVSPMTRSRALADGTPVTTLARLTTKERP